MAEHQTMIASDRITKIHLLRSFFQENNIQEENGLLANHSKFLYLFGESNTGKLTLIKEIAEDIFGNDWESKIYLRIDSGQKYPYKLHAHKVESSRKVIFITQNRNHWRKWVDLYPTSKTFYFEGAEVIPNPENLMIIRYGDFFQKFSQNNGFMRTNLDTAVKGFFQEKNLSDELANSLLQKLREELRNYSMNTLNALQSSEYLSDHYQH